MGPLGKLQWALHNFSTHEQQIIESHINDSACYTQWDHSQSPEMQCIFRTLVEQLFQLPWEAKHQWIDLVQLAHQRKQTHEYGCYVAEQKFM